MSDVSFDKLVSRWCQTPAPPEISIKWLGLSISSTIIESHRGQVTLSNATDGGAIAIVSLPTLAIGGGIVTALDDRCWRV